MLRHTAPRSTRMHIMNAEDWATECGTDFWMIATTGEQTVGVGAGRHTLDTHGWTTTSIVEYEGSGGDFLSAADDDPSAFHFDAQNDLLQSPVLFGSYAHARMVQEHLGWLPTVLSMEIFAQFVDATNNETNSCFGFVEGGGSIIVANDALATIFSDGTNYRLRSGATTSGVGPVDDTAWHKWRIKITSAGVEWFVDGASQNAGSLLALETDEFPVSFGIGVGGAGANTLKMSQAHIWYA